MNKQNIIMGMLFLIGAIIAIFSRGTEISTSHFVWAILLFVFFSVAYLQLRLKIKYGETELNYSINYGIALAIFTGPLGAIFYEITYNTLVYLINKWRDPAYKKPFLYTFYNISIFSFSNIFSYGYFTRIRMDECLF